MKLTRPRDHRSGWNWWVVYSQWLEPSTFRANEWVQMIAWQLQAGDLAWTATFSSLTSNTAITEPNAVWNYAIFFGLTWNLWATQVR